MEEIILSNGLRMLYCQIVDAYSTSIGLYVKCGSRYEDISNNGVTHFLEHIHFRRLGSLSQDEIYYKTESMGSTLRACTYKDFLRFYMKTHPKHFLDCLMIFKEILASTLWTKEDVELERKVILNELYEKSTYVNIESVVAKAVWGNNPLSLPIIGNEDSIKSLTLQSIVDYKNIAFQKERILLVITGCISERNMAKAKEMLEKVTLATEGPKALVCVSPKPRYVERKPDVCFSNCNWSIVDVCISFDVDIDFVQTEELAILNSILGGGYGSILQRSIREKKCLSSNVYSYFDFYEDAAVLHISFSIEKKNVYDGISGIMILLQGLKKRISERDFLATMPFFTNNLRFLPEDPMTMNFELGWQSFVRNREFLSVEEQIVQYEKVSIKRLVEISNSIFKPENTVITILGSTNKLTKKEIRRIVQDGL